MTTPGPAEQFQKDLNSLQFAISTLRDKVRLASLRDKIEDIQTTVHGMGQEIANLRQRGYAFESELEDQAADFVKQWASLKPGVLSQIERQSLQLQAALRPLETQANQLVGQSHAAARPRLTQVQAAVKTLEDNASAAERTIGGMFDTFDNQVYQVTKHLKAVEWMLTELAEAKFQLRATEAGIMAVKAVWAKSGKEEKDDPEGVLYLTDQRLLFEQKEEVATKKVLFITTEKQKVQNLLWEAPVALVESVETSKQGLLKNEDHIDIRLASGGPFPRLHLHIWQPCEEWLTLVNKAKAREFDKTRAIAIDQVEVDKVKSAPSQCPSCGGNISQVVLRGMDSIKCEYCGFVIRL
jgi:hypothetical protein